MGVSRNPSGMNTAEIMVVSKDLFMKGEEEKWTDGLLEERKNGRMEDMEDQDTGILIVISRHTPECVSHHSFPPSLLHFNPPSLQSLLIAEGIRHLVDRRGDITNVVFLHVFVYRGGDDCAEALDGIGDEFRAVVVFTADIW